MTEHIKTILLVDDNQIFLKMLSRAFNKAGIECLLSDSGAGALELLRTKQPDAILSDYEMPEMNGLEFRKQLLKHPVLKDIPFIFLTYFSNKELIKEGLDLQAVDYVIKDTPVNVIVAKLNNLLDTVQKQRELSESEIKKAAEALNVRSTPAAPPKIPGFDVAFWHKAYQDIPGGDFIDFIQANDRYSFIVLGDVMGKKWTAWFFTFSFLSYIRSAIRFGIFDQEYSTAVILQKVNAVICYDDVLKDILSSLSLLMIDHETQQITYSGAGDLPLLHYVLAEDELKQVSSSGLLLGMFADGNYTEQQINLAQGDELFIFTDGMIDFASDGGNKSDYGLFAKKLQPLMNKGLTFTELNEALLQSASKPVDDCSIISIRKSLTNDQHN